jgi:EAL domain-containing protein (putative c-di-GMP-specific phosphodiesterase class I)
MDNIDSVVSILHQFMDIGVSISIDDFGTGYSSLSYLKRLPISALKIDQSFIQDVINDGDDAIIVNTVITLAHSLGLKVVAEGVEDDEQLTFLQERNCDEAQGYFFSPPMPSDDFIGWLQGRQTEPLARVAM